MPPEAPDAWNDVFQSGGMSRLEQIYQVPVRAPPRRRTRRAMLLFVLLVLLPPLMFGGYFWLVAADRYMTEARFVVRNANAPSRTPGQGLSIEEGPKGFGGDDSYAVSDFLMSRDALWLLIDKADFRDAVAHGQSDWWWRFPGLLNGHSNEDLYGLYQSLVSVSYDPGTGVTTLHVEGFQAEDTRRIAAVLIQGGEALLNRLHERARNDAISVAAAEVARSRQDALLAQDRVTAFRERESMIDPTQMSKTVLETIGTLMLALVETRAQLSVTLQSSPHSPQLPLFRNKINALQQQIDRERLSLAGNDKSLAPRIAEYERLGLHREFAEKSFLSSLNLQEAARLDAQRQQAFLEQVVTPQAADEARYPKRILWTLAVFLAGLATFWAIRPQSQAART